MRHLQKVQFLGPDSLVTGLRILGLMNCFIGCCLAFAALTVVVRVAGGVWADLVAGSAHLISLESKHLALISDFRTL
jgi:hypothetical protein